MSYGDLTDLFGLVVSKKPQADSNSVNQLVEVFADLDPKPKETQAFPCLSLPGSRQNRIKFPDL